MISKIVNFVKKLQNILCYNCVCVEMSCHCGVKAWCYKLLHICNNLFVCNLFRAGQSDLFAKKLINSKLKVNKS